MKRFLKWGLIALVFAILTLAGAVLGLLRTSLPKMEGEFQVAALSAPVTIRFDDFERPYVRAETLDDALFAEGWLHATHRLWQMELFRRAGKGRLAQLLGGGMVESDEELWRMGVPQMARTLETNASAEMQGRIASYVAGVNAAITAMKVRPPEFLLLMAQPEPWSASDVYAMGALMAFQSAGNMENELLRLALLQESGPDRAAILITDDISSEDANFVIPPVTADAALAVLNRLAAVDPLDQALMPRFAFGSNGWVVSPSRSETGKALFAFDSHDDLGVPNLFYEVHLFFGEGRQIRGWSVPGLPGVINGYNEKVAWGFTNIGDTQDLFVETRSQEDPLKFKNGDEWYIARTETVEIPVRGRAEPESCTIVHTINGPLISEDPPIALRWTVQDLSGLGIDTILEFNLAQSAAEFAEVLDRFAAPSLNATFADVDGNIGFRTAGLLPLRGAGDGLVPLAGDDPANRWVGLVPAEELPELINPAAGFVAAANSRVNAPGDGPLVSADNAPIYRVRRIQSVLASKSKLTTADMRALQTDWWDTQAELLLPSMMESPDAVQFSPIEREAWDALTAWKDAPAASPESAATAVFQAWYRALAAEVFKPSLSEDTFKHLFRSNYPLNHALDRLILREPDSEWWNGERAAKITVAFRRAVEEVRGRQGDDVSAWRWDAMHNVQLNHELGNAVPQLAWFFNLEHAAWGGSTATVGRARFRYDRAYDVRSAATVRVVGEMSSPPRMQAVMPGGQSGHPLSEHYGDQVGLWLNKELIPIPATPEEADGARVVLRPRN